MAEITSLINNTPINISQLIDWTPLLDKFKIAINVGLIILLAYIAYKIISLILSRMREKRIKITYQNTKEILKKLEEIEKKINRLSKPPKGKKKRKK